MNLSYPQMFWWKNYVWCNVHRLFLISEQEQKYQFRREQSQGHILVAAAEKEKSDFQKQLPMMTEKVISKVIKKCMYL